MMPYVLFDRLKRQTQDKTEYVMLPDKMTLPEAALFMLKMNNSLSSEGCEAATIYYLDNDCRAIADDEPEWEGLHYPMTMPKA
jgi:hypothetical protein